VKQQTTVVVERFGKFLSIRQSGLHLKIPLIDQCRTCESKNQQLDVSLKQNQRQRFVKTKSFSSIVIKETVYDAFINWNTYTNYFICIDVVRAEYRNKTG
jgi:hypothetical protein